MSTAILSNNNLDWQSSSVSQCKLLATASVLTLSGVSGVPVEIKNVADPSADSSAATKSYVDSISNGAHWLEACHVRAGANVVLSSPGASLDGVTMTQGDRVLCDEQTTPTEDGIYIWDSAVTAMTRSADFADGDAVASHATFIEQGTFSDAGYVVSNDTGSDIVGTDDIVFVRFTGLSDILAGEGLSKSANTLNVNVDNSSIEVSTDALQVKDAGITNAKLANPSLTVTAGNGLSTTSASIALGASASLSVNVDDVGIEIVGDSLQLKDDGVNRDKIAWGTTGDQVNAEDLPLTSHSWNQIVAPTDTMNALEQLDDKLNDAVAGGITLANGVSTIPTGNRIDVQVDDSSIEVSGVIGSDFLQVKALGVTDAMLAGSISNAKLTNSAVTVTAGDGLQTGGSVSLGGSVTVDVDATVVRTSGNQDIAGIKSLTDTTQATSSTTGCLILDGGVGVAKDIRCAGDAYALSHVSTSDERLKKNVVKIDNALSIINKLEPVYFNWLDSSVCKKQKAGFLAQQVQKVVPESVMANGDHLSLDYQHLNSILFKAVQELSARVSELEKN